MVLAIGTNCLDFVILLVSPVFWVLFIGRVLAGITGASLTVAGGYTADLTLADKRALGSGMVAGTFALGMVIGPAFGGYLAAFGLCAPFFAAAALSAISVTAIWHFLPGSLARTSAARSGSRVPTLWVPLLTLPVTRSCGAWSWPC